VIITKEQSIIEVVQQYPKTIEVFRNYGMGCFGCAAARYENIEQGAAAHGIDIEALVADLNKAIQETNCGDCCSCGSH
jgi:hybrid cluster-associated redox disulfide protein